MSEPRQVPLDPLPAKIADLLARERDAYPEDPARREAVRGRVEMAVGLAGPALAGTAAGGGAAGAASGAAVARSAIAGKGLGLLLAAFVSGSVVGGAVVGVAVRGGSATAPTAASAASSTSAASATVSSTVFAPSPGAVLVAPAGSPGESARPAPSTTASGGATATGTPSSTSDRGADLTRERELLDVARAALGRGRPADALAAAQEHAARWPRGALSEEREVILIQALVAAGRRGEAEQRASRFRKGYPRSVLLPAVDAALSSP